MGLAARSGVEGGGRTTIQYWGKAVPPFRYTLIGLVILRCPPLNLVRCLGESGHQLFACLLFAQKRSLDS